MTGRALVVGARRSPLAVAQAEWVGEQLRALGHAVTVTGVTSLGDVDRRALTEIGGTGVFATAVRDELHARTIDIAVHSLKDLPVAPAPGLTIGAIPPREAVNDVLVGLAVDAWTDDTVVGTGSPRRQAQLAALAASAGVHPTFVPVRGNVDRRLDLVRHGEVHATVLARAGLARLGRVPSAGALPGDLAGVPVHELPLDAMLPAAGQGALAVECRSDDRDVLALLGEIDHGETRAAVEAERAFLNTLEAGCLAPIGAHATVTGAELDLRVAVGRPAGVQRHAMRGRTSEGALVGRRLAQNVLAELTE